MSAKKRNHAKASKMSGYHFLILSDGSIANPEEIRKRNEEMTARVDAALALFADNAPVGELN